MPPETPMRLRGEKDGGFLMKDVGWFEKNLSHGTTMVIGEHPSLLD